MGAGVVILIWLIIAAAYSFVLLIFSGLWFLGYKKKKRWLKWLAGIPVAGMTAIAILIAGVVGFGLLNSMNPKTVFKGAFGVAPSSGISSLQSSYFWFADTGSIYLRFKTSQDEFQKLIPAGLEKKTATQMEIESPLQISTNTPSWWNYTIDPTWIYYSRNHSGQEKPGPKGFYWEIEIAAYDPRNNFAYYHFLGID